MAVYAIGDLHLSGWCAKPMHVFGEHWANHFERISADWRARVDEQDVVLLPGDFSWAMTLQQAMPDIEAVAALPGRKVLVRGNHDFWWSSVTQVRTRAGQGHVCAAKRTVWRWMTGYTAARAAGPWSARTPRTPSCTAARSCAWRWRSKRAARGAGATGLRADTLSSV